MTNEYVRKKKLWECYFVWLYLDYILAVSCFKFGQFSMIFCAILKYFSFKTK